MSLINEALKRAKDVKVPPPVSPGPQLRPVESNQNPRTALGFMAPATFGVLSVVALALVWQWLHADSGPTSSELGRQPVVAAAPVVPARTAPDPNPAVTEAKDSDQASAATAAPEPPKPAPL